MRRWISVLMTVLMVCGMLPMQAFAMRVQHNITAMNSNQSWGTGQQISFSPYLIFDKNCEDSVGNMPGWIDVNYPDGQNASNWKRADVTIPAVRVTRADYVFMGWAESKEGEAKYGIFDKDQKKITNLSVSVTKESSVKTLYAVWMTREEFIKQFGSLDNRLKQNEPGINKTVNGKNFALASPGDALSFTLESTVPDNLAGLVGKDNLRVDPYQPPQSSGVSQSQNVLQLLQSAGTTPADEPQEKTQNPDGTDENGENSDGNGTTTTPTYELVFHDQMSQGLVLKEETIRVAIGDKPIDAADYTVVTDKDTVGDDCTFHVVLDLVALYNKYHFALNDVDIVNKIQVTYDAEYTGKGGTPEDGNKSTNTAWVTYPNCGDNPPKSEVEVASGKLVVKKVDYTTKEVLGGAEFELYDAGPVEKYQNILAQANQSMLAQANQSNQGVLSLPDGESGQGTDMAESMIRDTNMGTDTTAQSRSTEKLSTGTINRNPGQNTGTMIDPSELTLLGKTVTGEDGLGKFDFSLGEGHLYILKEVKAPDGYVGVTQDMMIVLTQWAEEGQFVVTYEVPNVKVAETGGVGTRMFTIIGLAVMAGAGAAFVISRRKRED